MAVAIKRTFDSDTSFNFKYGLDILNRKIISYLNEYFEQFKI